MPPRSTSSFFRNLLGYCLFAIGIAIVWKQVHTYHPGEILEHFMNVHPFTLALCALLILSDYLVMTLYDVLAFRFLHRHIAPRAILLKAFIGQAFSINVNVLTGSAIRFRLYHALKLTLQDITSLVLFSQATFLLGFVTLGAIVFLDEPIVIPNALHLPFGSVRILGFICAVIIAAFFLSTWRRSPIRIQSVTIPAVPMSLLGLQLITSCSDWLLSALTLFVFLPGSADLSFFSFLGIYLLAQLFGQISQSPAGLGVFEAAMLVMLPASMPSDAALGGLLLFRILYYFVPFLVALLLFVYVNLQEGAPEQQRVWKRLLHRSN